MATSAVLAIKIISDATKAAREMDGLSKSTSTFGDRIGKASRVAKGMLLGLGGLGVGAFKAASDLQQAGGAVESVFGRQAAAVNRLAKQAATAVGLAQADYSNLAAVLGAQLSNLGVSQGKLVGTTRGLIKTGADLSAMFGGTTKEAVEALSAALRGETDPIERYGVSIKQANIQAVLAARGQTKLTGAAAKQAKTQAVLSLITKQTAKAQGQWARETDTASHQQQVAMAKLKNAAAEFGTALLPVVTKAAQLLGDLAGWVDRNQRTFKVLVAVVGGLAAAVVGVEYALRAYHAIQTAIRVATIVWRNAQLALNVALMANPVGVVIAAVVALVAIIVLAYKKSETFRRIVQAVMKAARRAVGWVVDKLGDLVGWVRKKAPAALRFLKRVAVTYFRIITAPVRILIRVVSDLVGWIRSKAPSAWRWLRSTAVSVWRRITSPAHTLIDVVRSIVRHVRGGLASAFRFIKRVATGAINAILWPIRQLLDLAARVKDILGSIHLPHIPGLSSLIGKITGSSLLAAPTTTSSTTSARTLMASTTMTATPSTAGYSYGASAGTGAAVVININGALDPDAVARQIQRILGRRNTRIGARA